MSVNASDFSAIGTTHRIVATRPDALSEAERIARVHLAALDRAASRFRPDSEVSRLAARGGEGTVTARVSPLLADHIRVALRAARLTGGLVDPTVGAALVASGYDDDLDVVRSRRTWTARPAVVPGWRRIALDERSLTLTVPAGTLLDLGATAKAHAADTIADLLALRLPGGFLVDLGGDIATSGTTPTGGWAVAVEGPAGEDLQTVLLHGQGMTTSSTRLRTWRTDLGPAHHIVDPRTGATAPAHWAQVTVVAATALEANAASTAALVLGPDAPAWLDAHALPARLDDLDGATTFTAGWPLPLARAS